MIDYTRIPPGIGHGLATYVELRQPSGSFLQAVFSNDLKEACARADEGSARALFDIVAWLHNYAPSTCYGSPANYSEWIAGFMADPPVKTLRTYSQDEGLAKLGLTRAVVLGR